MRFRSKPKEIDAFRFDARAWEAQGRPGPVRCDDGVRGAVYYVITIGGTKAPALDGDWIITEKDGRSHYPCNPEVFFASYDPIREQG